jgi:hypothetical protein
MISFSAEGVANTGREEAVFPLKIICAKNVEVDRTMSKFKVQMKFKFQISNAEHLTLGHLPFIWHLTFACLPVGRDFDFLISLG